MTIDNGHTVTQTRKFLFLTNAESGQANPALAMAHEASTRPGAEVHIASFPVLAQRVAGLSPGLTFHPLDGKDLIGGLKMQGFSERDLPHLPTAKDFAPYGKNMTSIMAGWSGASYMRIYESAKKVIEELNPGVIVVDPMLNPGIDACYSLNRDFIISSPNTPLDLARAHQPWLKGFWYYPTFGTGISFPVSWSDIPLNFVAALVFIWKATMSPEITELIKYRNAHGLPGRLPMESAITRATHIICSGARETDFPLVIPNWLGLYGPITLDTTPVEVSDPGLYQWLNGGKTVFMCMGTMFRYSESQVKAVINGFLGAVAHDSKTQFLWKLPDSLQFGSLIEEALKSPRDKDRFRIVDWLESDPASIMKHPNVIAWVHHGGANSYFEGTLAGLPQIILAQWYDLYDMAVRAEYLGIGTYGNKKVAPDFEAVEFGTAIARLVLPGKESEGFRMRAKVVAEACRKAGGKRAAVDKLIEIIDGK